MTRRKKKRVKTMKSPSNDPLPGERKIQRQYYVTQSLIDGLEELRAHREAELRTQLGGHVDLTTSQFIGSVIHDLVREHHKRTGKAK